MFRVLLTLLLTLTFSVAASASAIFVNGSCITGGSCSPSVAPNPTDTMTPFSFDFSSASGDRFNVSGTDVVLNNDEGGITLDTPMTVTFLGNGLSNAASTTDTVSVVVQQGFAFPQTLSFDEGLTSVAGIFSGSFGPGTVVTYFDQQNDQINPMLGPFTPDSGALFTQTITDFPVTLTSPSFLVQLHFNFTFGAGTTPGSSIRNLSFDEAAAVPEPETYVLGGLGLIAVTIQRRWRRRNAGKSLLL